MGKDSRHNRRKGPPLLRGQGGILLAVAAGGALGALARYGLAVVWPALPGVFPWHTFVANAAGSALLGITIVLVSEARTAHPYVRPFLGTGVLGGFTTFSAYSEEVVALMEHGQIALAGGYAVATLAAALLGAWAGIRVTRAVALR